MAEVILLFGRILLLGLLYLFLLAAIRAGVGVVKRGGAGKAPAGLGVTVVRGPREIKGVTLPLAGPLVVGRSPDADFVIADDFVSSLHCRISPSGEGAVIEDLGSTNGTLVNGQPAQRPLQARVGDVIELGANQLKVVRL
ncbi:MAG: hypothetical protein Kow0067_01460 [Coriobacteriia bacterium]